MYVYIFVYIYMYIYMCMYIYIYIYIYNLLKRPSSPCVAAPLVASKVCI